MWSQIPDGICDRALDCFEHRAYTSLVINLGRCKETWIAEYILQYWNNPADPLKLKKQKQR